MIRLEIDRGNIFADFFTSAVHLIVGWKFFAGLEYDVKLHLLFYGKAVPLRQQGLGS